MYPQNRADAGPTGPEAMVGKRVCKNRRYRPEQVYHGCGVHQAAVTVVRGPNDLADLEMFLGFKVTAEDRALFRKHPYYATAKVIQGETFHWMWREGATEYLKAREAKPYWWACV